MVKRFPQQITIVAIGIPTNLGLCSHRYPDFAELVGHIVLMGGGSFVTQRSVGKGSLGVYSIDSANWGENGSGTSCEKAPYRVPTDHEAAIRMCLEGDSPVHLFPNHNTSGDSLATLLTMKLNCPISVLPHYITAQHWLKGLAIETLLDIGAPPSANRLGQTQLSTPKRAEENNGGREEKHEGGEKHGENVELGKVCGRLLWEWLRTRGYQRGQCPHDPLTLYEAVFLQPPDEPVFEDGRSSLVYARGTFVAHAWASFLTFVPCVDGPHRLAVKCLDPAAWLVWLEQTLLRRVPANLHTKKSTVMTSRHPPPDWD
jgi:hypothetical protein